jgi:uncharacterized protein (DUF433 family)
MIGTTVKLLDAYGAPILREVVSEMLARGTHDRGAMPRPASTRRQTGGCKLWWLRYVSAVDYRGIVTIEPGKRGGKPCIRGLRITVYDVLEYLASGMSEAEILADFPDLTSDDIRACLAFAADRERRLLSVPAA